MPGQPQPLTTLTESLSWGVVPSCLTPALKVAYSTLARWPTTWLVLGVEALNGITFACAWPAGTLHCSRIAPHGMEATTQVRTT